MQLDAKKTNSKITALKPSAMLCQYFKALPDAVFKWRFEVAFSNFLNILK